MTSRIRPVPTVLLCAASVLALASPGSAQLRLIPRAGLFAPVTDLGTVSSPSGARSVGQHQASFAYGLTLELAAASPVSLRATLLYGSRSRVPVGGIGCTGSECDLRSTLLTLTGSLALRPFPAGLPLRPYLLAGGGLKRYDFDFGGDPSIRDAFRSDSHATALLGVGLDWNLLILRGDLVLTDLISASVLDTGDRQHDFFLTVGLFLG